MVFFSESNPFVVCFKPITNGIRHWFSIDATLSRIPQNRMHSIVASDDDKAMFVSEDIEVGKIGSFGKVKKANLLCVAHLCIQEGLGSGLRGLHTDVFGEGRDHRSKQDGHK